MIKCPVPLLAASIALAPAWALSASVAAPPAGGTISLEPKTADGDYDSALPSFTDAVSEALAARGFTILPDPGHAAYVADLTLSRVEVGTGKAKVRTDHASVIPGASAGTGVGVVIPLPTGKSTLVPLLRTRLDLGIRKRGETTLVWHASAVTVRAAGTRKGADDVVATDLAQTALRPYPAQPEDVVGIP